MESTYVGSNSNKGESMARRSVKNIIQMLEEDSETSSVQSQFLRDLKRTIELEEQANKRKGSNYYKPSGMNCMRAMYYTRIEAETDKEDIPYTLVGICNSGTDIHERTQKYVDAMNKHGFDCEYVDVATYIQEHDLKNIEIVQKCGMETKLFHTSLKMSFLVDGIIKYQGKYYILELKTEISNKWYNRDGVDPKHYNQATAYSLALGIEDVIFVYINRDNLDMKSFMYSPTKEEKIKLETKLVKCEWHVKHKTEKCE